MNHATGRPTSSNVTSESCTLDDLWKFNETKQFRHFDQLLTKAEGQPLPYNEVRLVRDRGWVCGWITLARGSLATSHPFHQVYTKVHAGALVGLFARTFETQHLLYLMGVRARMLDALGVRYPIFVLSAEQGVVPFPEVGQRLYTQAA